MFRIVADTSRMDRWLRSVMDSQPFVTAVALTRTAQAIKSAEVESMAKVFDRPTRFTLNALMVVPATKKRLVAEVDFKPGFGSIPAWRYLGPQVEGGGRAKKAHELALQRAGILRADEYVVPGTGMPLDAAGNMKPGEIVRILSQVAAAETKTGYAANMTAKSKARNTRRAKGRYFVMRGRAAPDGIYKRTDLRTIEPVMIFVSDPRYERRLPFYQTAREVQAREFPVLFRAAWLQYAAPAIARGRAA